MKKTQEQKAAAKLELEKIPGVVVISPEESFEKSYTDTDKKHASVLQQFGVEITTATVKLGSKYFELCKYIRTNKIAPRLASHELAKSGLHKVRISEINRVANAGDDVWHEIEGRLIGFQRALELSRDNVQKLIAGESHIEVESVKAGLDELGFHESGAGVEKPEPSKADKKKSLERAATQVLNIAEYLNLKKQVFTLGNGWTLTVTKDANKKTVKDSGKPASDAPAA